VWTIFVAAGMVRIMTHTIKDKLEAGPLFDSGIIEHHFTRYMRDYDLIIDVAATRPDRSGFYIEGRYRYRFTHCVVAQVTTAVSDESWRQSWTEEYTDYHAWERAGAPEGYVWGVEYMDAYPGLTYLQDSPLVQEWSRRLGRSMHEVLIKTNGHNIQLIFHDVVITKIAEGDPNTDELAPLESAD
jgi:hypothetical protein